MQEFGDRKSRQDCPHASEIKITTSKQAKCSECDDTEHLRICTSCGGVFCCESSNSHDAKHFRQTGHPIIKPIHCNYDFTWCYACNAYLE